MLPAICTEERITLGAEMANGTIIRGQNEISHPAAPGQRQLEPSFYPCTLIAACFCHEPLAAC